MTGVRPAHLRLTRGGTPLNATERLSDHDIKEGDTIECKLSINGGDCVCCAVGNE